MKMKMYKEDEMEKEKNIKDLLLNYPTEDEQEIEQIAYEKMTIKKPESRKKKSERRAEKSRYIPDLLRRNVLNLYNYECVKCMYKPENEVDARNLHLHHVNGMSNELSNLILLCRWCHMNEHSKHSCDNHLLQLLLDIIRSKYDVSAWLSRSVRRLSAIYKLENGYMVEGILGGDYYDWYDIDLNRLFCECYTHNYGEWRYEIGCTHVGVAIIYDAYNKISKGNNINDVGKEIIYRIEKSKDLSCMKKFRKSVVKELQAKHFQNEMIVAGLNNLHLIEEYIYGWKYKCDTDEVEINIDPDTHYYVCMKESDCNRKKSFVCVGKMAAMIYNKIKRKREKMLEIKRGKVYDSP